MKRSFSTTLLAAGVILAPASAVFGEELRQSDVPDNMLGQSDVPNNMLGKPDKAHDTPDRSDAEAHESSKHVSPAKKHE